MSQFRGGVRPCSCNKGQAYDGEDCDWLTPTVLALAEAAYHERLPDGLLDPVRLVVLADCLEDAGCNSAELLAHLRGPGPHVRGCWAVDLVLGKDAAPAPRRSPGRRTGSDACPHCDGHGTTLGAGPDRGNPTCGHCGGTGVRGGDCPQCRGRGELTRYADPAPDLLAIRLTEPDDRPVPIRLERFPCPHCAATGRAGGLRPVDGVVEDAGGGWRAPRPGEAPTAAVLRTGRPVRHGLVAVRRLGTRDTEVGPVYGPRREGVAR